MGVDIEIFLYLLLEHKTFLTHFDHLILKI